MKIPLFPKRPEIENKWWNRLAEVLVLGATGLALLFSIIVAINEDDATVFWLPVIVYLVGVGLYHTGLYIGFGHKQSHAKNALQKASQSQKEIVSRAMSKEDKVGLHIKWCNLLFLGGILVLLIGAGLESDAIAALGGIALLGVVYCMIAIEIMVWKSGWKYLAIVALLLGGLIGIIAFFYAYGDALKMLKKAGYTIGLFGPKEMTFSGQKIKPLTPAKATASNRQPTKAKVSEPSAAKQKGYFSNWLVNVDSIEGAKKATAQGYGIAYFVAILTGIIALIAFSTGESIGGIDEYAIVDVLLMGLAGLGMQFYSRTAAVGALVLFVLGKIAMISEGTMNAGGWFMTVIIIFAFINGIRGTFAYQRFRQEHAAIA